MAFWAGWLTVFVLGLVAVVTPGPDFALTLRSSLAYSRRAGVYTAVGTRNSTSNPDTLWGHSSRAIVCVVCFAGGAHFSALGQTAVGWCISLVGACNRRFVDLAGFAAGYGRALAGLKNTKAKGIYIACKKQN